MNKHKLAAMGGTFDHFHKGHQTLIRHAFEVAEAVIIGITNKSLTTNKQCTYSIEPFETRWKAVQSFVDSLGKNNEATLVELTDIFGPTLKNPHIDCLVVSPLTKPGAEYINMSRLHINLPTLPIEVCTLEKDVTGVHISSTRIRKGAINREGFVYQELLNKTVSVPKEIRSQLKKPFGTLVGNPQKKDVQQLLNPQSLTVAVGDTVSQFCLENNLPVETLVFDNQVKRQTSKIKVQDLVLSSDLLSCKSPAGIISQELGKTLKQAFKERKNVLVYGEEDLAVIPAVLLLPLESRVLYGQPDEGIVVVTVTEAKKEWCRKLVLRLH
ncbi:MAG: pantetheine-phosphate adenylyltransferase [Patescibacteria group bacterium]|jgi:cytidyltransferase-like protein